MLQQQKKIILPKYDNLIINVRIILSLLYNIGSMVTARAVFQLQSDRIYTSQAFEVDTISKTEGKAIHLEVKIPADVAIGE